MFGTSRELLAQVWVLGGNAHGAGIEVAYAHHDAAFHHQGSGGKAEFLSTE